MDSIRHYRGKHKIKIIFKNKNKALIQHLEKGYVGNKEIGYKDVKKGNFDITLLRFCWKRKL